MFQDANEDDDMQAQVDYMPPAAPRVGSPALLAPEQPIRVAAPVVQPSVAVRPLPAPVVVVQAAAPNPDVTERAHMLGFGLIASSLGALAGLRIGGVYGGVAGTLFAGSTVNLYRAVIHASRKTPEGHREAIISGTYSLLAVGLGGYIAYKTGKLGKDATTQSTYTPPLPLISNRKGLKGLY